MLSVPASQLLGVVGVPPISILSDDSNKAEVLYRGYLHPAKLENGCLPVDGGTKTMAGKPERLYSDIFMCSQQG